MIIVCIIRPNPTILMYTFRGVCLEIFLTVCVKSKIANGNSGAISYRNFTISPDRFLHKGISKLQMY